MKSGPAATRVGIGASVWSIVPDPRTPCVPAPPQQKTAFVDESPHVCHERGVMVANDTSPTTAVGTVLSADLFAASVAPVPSRPSCGDPQQYA